MHSLTDPERRVTIVIIAASIAVGLGTGFYLSRPHRPETSSPDAPIEWNKVQAVPARSPDAEDKEWQERADALDAPTSTARPADPQNAAQ